MTAITIHDCDLLRLEHGQIFIDPGQDIMIVDNQIKAIVPSRPVIQGEAGEVIEAHGLLALPGLINTHAHVPMVLFRGVVEDVSAEAWFNDYIWVLESNLTADDVYLGALLGQAEMIENGITSVADNYFFMDRVAEAAAQSGMRAVLGQGIFASGGQAMLDQSCQFIERWQGRAGGRITTILAPHAPYTTGPDFLRLCAQRAKDLQVGIEIHVSESQKQVDQSLAEFGITPVKMLAETGILDSPTILGHCTYATDQDVEILGEYPAGVAHAPKTYLKLGWSVTDLTRYRKAGVPVGLASDGTASNNTLDLFEQMRIMALTQKQLAQDATVMTVAETLALAFKGSARVMRMGDKIGELSPGMLADIILLRQDGLNYFPPQNLLAHLVYSARSSDVDTVICDGKVLMLNRRLLTIDKEQIKRELAPRLKALSERVPGRQIATYPV